MKDAEHGRAEAVGSGRSLLQPGKPDSIALREGRLSAARAEVGGKGRDEMREDAPSTEIMNSLSKVLDVSAMLAVPRLWRWLCNAKPAEERREMIVDALAWFLEAAPLDGLPEVRAFGASKDMIRDAAAVAAKMKLALDTWDASTDPPPALAALGREFLTCVGIPENFEFPTPTETP